MMDAGDDVGDESRRSLQENKKGTDRSSSSSSSSSESSDDDSSIPSSSSSSSSSSSFSPQLPTPQQQQQRGKKDNDDENDKDKDIYTTRVRAWVQAVPIGLQLCPWAVYAHHAQAIRYTSCACTTPTAVAERVLVEIQALLAVKSSRKWSTTLLVCPHVTAWNQDFAAFDEFFKNVIETCTKMHNSSSNRKETDGKDNDSDSSPATKSGSVDKETKEANVEIQNNDEAHNINSLEGSTRIQDLMNQVTLVAFHPLFLQWHGLPPGIGVGSTVYAHRRKGFGWKSRETWPATLLETHNRMFGQRKLKVRFHHHNYCQGGDGSGGDGYGDDSNEKEEKMVGQEENEVSRKEREQYVPVNWMVFHGDNDDQNDGRDRNKNARLLGPPLPDNAMHRAPYPTIHLIRNYPDLAQLALRDVSQVKRRNIQRIRKLGWTGLQQAVAAETAPQGEPEATME